MKHQKHAKLARPNLGNFARNEWAIIGTPCGNIQRLAAAITQQLAPDYKVAYVDADHKNADEPELVLDSGNAWDMGANMVYTDKITFHEFHFHAQLEPYQFRTYFNEQDVVLVNGNHFKAKHQIVVVDPKKEKSLQKKLDRLSSVQLILFVDGVRECPDFLREHLPNIDQIPSFSITDVPAIVAFLSKELTNALPVLNGLVLAGGKSQRMGVDKGSLDYHGKPQREYMADLLQPLCQNTYLSCRADQVERMTSAYPLLVDTFTGLGPFGAIASAFRHQPNAAWLVVACDLPLLDAPNLSFLVENRNPSAMATAFNSPNNEFPEPLITIWEPRSYPILLSFLTQGYSCPRKVLINSPVHLLDVPNKDALRNVNTKEELEAVKKQLLG